MRYCDLLLAFFALAGCSLCQSVSFAPAVPYASGGNDSLSVAVADLNGDGRIDLVVANCGPINGTCGGAGVVSVLLGNGDGTFQPAVNYRTGAFAAWAVAVGDVNGDGKPDIIAANACVSFTTCTPGVVSVLLGTGDGKFETAVTYSSGGEFANSIQLGDVNRDGKLDIVVGNDCDLNSSNCFGNNTGFGTGEVSVLLGNGDGTFQSAIPYDTGGQISTSVALADVNRDGKLDILALNMCKFGQPPGCQQNPSANSLVAILFGNGDGTFQPAVTYSSGGASGLAISDLNGDGNPDLVAVNEPQSIVNILLGNGDGTFQTPVGYGLNGLDPIGVNVADLNGDGIPDLLVANECASNPCLGYGSVDVLLGTGSGTFQPVVAYNTAGINSIWAIAADVNADGYPDLIVPSECGVLINGNCPSPETGNVSVLLSTTGPARVTTTTSLSSSPNPVGLNQTVAYTAIVMSKSGGPVTGLVSFKDGSKYMTAPVQRGTAVLTESYATVGDHSVTATYLGDRNHLSSSSPAITEYVEKLPISTKTSVTTSQSPSLVGQLVTFTASITSTFSIPNGETVTFYDGVTEIGTGTTANGSVSFSTSGLTVKTHTIKATYAGDTTFKSSSGTVTQVVNAYATATALSSSPNPSDVGQPVTLTATVTTTGPIPPTGKVTFYNGATSIGGATLGSTGTATLTTKKLPVGTDQLTATYHGDSFNAESTSAVVMQTVN